MDCLDYNKMALALKAIAHPQRLEIIESLKGEEMTVSEIQKRLNIKQSATSQYLNKMKSRGILKARREGNIVYYSIANRDVLKVIRCLESC